MSQKEIIKFLTILPNNDNERLALDMLNCIKRDGGIERNKICSTLSISNDYKNQFIDKCVNVGLLESEKEEDVEKIKFSVKKYNFLGIGFVENKCYVNVVNMKNEVITSAVQDLPLYIKPKMKSDDIVSILGSIKDAGIDVSEVHSVSVAVPEYFIGENKNLNHLVDGLNKEFKLPINVVKHATACAYWDRESIKTTEDNILFMYSDVGTGVVLKKELIFEATDATVSGGGEYLRPWNQYSVVEAAKDFVSKGVGTEIVHIVGGNMEKINTEIVLEAASKGDELSRDLIRRSGLALGVRVAYLVDLFNVETVVFGGDINGGEEIFINTVRESMSKFLDADLMKQVKLIQGVLGKESSSLGAAVLSRRQIFMEV